MNFGKTLANLLIKERPVAQASISSVDKQLEWIASYDLGDYSQDKKRTRRQIYQAWQAMQSDPQIAEALSLHVTAALGGHESTGDVIFISPHERVRGKGKRAEQLRTMVEREARIITPIINRHAFALARQAIAYGDSYARIYSEKGKGVLGLMNNEHTKPDLIQSFEQGEHTVGFFVLEMKAQERVITKLDISQMLRIKMPRIENVPQAPMASWLDTVIVNYDDSSQMPVIPAEIGGSFLYAVEGAWRDAVVSLAGLNNQQIADSVRQAFLTVNMEGMPEAQQKNYQKKLIGTLTNYRNQIRKAFDGGEALFGTTYHILPTWGDKQTITPIGDLSQRTSPLTTDTLMLNLRRVAGGLGLDLSLIGWADMLAGGLGDGASFHTSAQIMRRSMLIRQALIDGFNWLMNLHFGLKYGETFKDGQYPWQFDFYSDQSAAATESLTNKQTRMNTLALHAQTLLSLKETGLSSDSIALMLENIGGMDMDTAQKIAQDLKESKADENDSSGMEDE